MFNKPQLQQNITVRTAQGNRQGTVLKVNPKTVVVRLPDGNIVKRHIAKHIES